MVNLNNLKVGSRIKVNYLGYKPSFFYKTIFINKYDKAVLVLIDKKFGIIKGWYGNSSNVLAHGCRLKLDKNKTYWWINFSQITEIQTLKLNLE